MPTPPPLLAVVAIAIGASLIAHPARLAPERASVSPTTPDVRPAVAARARAAILRSLPLLQSSAATWTAKRSCTSCHHQGLGLMTMAVARERGFPVDTLLLAEQVIRTARPDSNLLERYVLGEISINEAIGQSYRAVGTGSAGSPPSNVSAAISHLLAGRQHSSGRWSSYSRRPPHEDSEFTATALTIRALRLFPLRGREREVDERIARGRDWLQRALPEDTEDRGMQLLGLAWAGVPSAELRPAALALLAQQRPDGGWSQVPTRPSDAYATGEALVALNQGARVPMTDARMQRGLDFLLRVQLPDGSWHVRTRRTSRPGLPYFESGYPHGRDQFISYAGAAWATLALMLGERETLSRALMGEPDEWVTVARPPALAAGITPLMERALFGTRDEMRALLRDGAAVDDTSALGLTPLMFAIHDSAKARLLLDAGANPNAKARFGHTPLYLAAAFDGARGSVALLLARGATIDVPVIRSNTPGMTAFGRAVVRADSALALELLSRGARIEGADEGEAPLVAATYYGDDAMVRWLLARGASLNGGLPPGEPTPLMFAAEEGRHAVVRALLSAGAEVNATDSAGMSALHFAAESIDRGSTVVVDALLAAGASRDARTSKGETAAVIARRWGKEALARHLAPSR